VVGSTLQFNNDPNAITADQGLLSTFPGGINGGGSDDQFTYSNTAPGILRGEAGNDTFAPSTAPAPTAPISIDGGDGNDAITGSPVAAGGDKLLGGAGDDIITAGVGPSTIVGGPGLDRMTGGAGADVFAFQASDLTGSALTADQINGFTPTDKIGLGPGLTSVVITPEVVSVAGVAATPDTALTYTDASGVKKYLAVLVDAAVTPAQLATVLTNVSASTFTV
jgi:hypothetical protein